MKNSKFVFDKFTKLLEQGLVSSRDLKNEIVNILKSKRDEIVFKMKLTSKDEFDILAKRVENLEKELEKIPDIESNREKYNITSWSLEPGDLIAFNFATVHGAPGNSSKNRRRAFSARFTGDDARFIKRKGEISPPFPEVLLNSGDKMDCDTFPKIDF